MGTAEELPVGAGDGVSVAGLPLPVGAGDGVPGAGLPLSEPPSARAGPGTV